MRLTILGSGTNIHPTRAASGYLVRTDHTLLLDFGPRTLANLMKTGVNRHRITHILFSHYHADHFSDFITYFFDAMIFTKYQGGTRPPLTVIGPRGTKRFFRTLFATLPGFTHAPFPVHFKEVSDRAFAIGQHESDSPNGDPHTEPPLPGISHRIWRESPGLFRRFAILRQPRAPLRRRRSRGAGLFLPGEPAKPGPSACRSMWTGGERGRSRPTRAVAFVSDHRTIQCAGTGRGSVRRKDRGRTRT